MDRTIQDHIRGMHDLPDGRCPDLCGWCADRERAEKAKAKTEQVRGALNIAYAGLKIIASDATLRADEIRANAQKWLTEVIDHFVPKSEVDKASTPK